MTPDLAGRIAAATGAGSGLGAAMAGVFAGSVTHGSFRPVCDQRRAALDAALDRMEAP